MENCQLRCHLQIWQDDVLRPKILLSDFTPIMFWETAGIDCGETPLPRSLDLWRDTSITDGCPTRKLCNDALLHPISPIATSISKKKTTNQTATRPAVLTLDIEGAFNQIHPSTLLEIMSQCQMPSYLTNWVAAFNTDQKIAFGFDQQSEDPQPYHCGLPQQSLISPILFLIYSNVMLEKQHYPADAIDT